MPFVSSTLLDAMKRSRMETGALKPVMMTVKPILKGWFEVVVEKGVCHVGNLVVIASWYQQAGEGSVGDHMRSNTELNPLTTI